MSKWPVYDNITHPRGLGCVAGKGLAGRVIVDVRQLKELWTCFRKCGKQRA